MLAGPESGPKSSAGPAASDGRAGIEAADRCSVVRGVGDPRPGTPHSSCGARSGWSSCEGGTAARKKGHPALSVVAESIDA